MTPIAHCGALEGSDMSQLWEPTLFDAEGVDAVVSVNVESLVAATHHRLDDHSWLTHAHGFLTGHRQLLDLLSTDKGWEQRSRWMYNRVVDEPRLTNEFQSLTTAPALVCEIADALSDHCGVRYDGVWMNWYRDHRDGTGWHADRPANLAATAAVPVLSLGAARRFLIRPAGGGPSTVLVPDGGDLVIMHGRCQRDWQHCVPKQRKPATARMSLNFTSTAQGTP
jgi:alkylated DNA repair dioxygenase AlkB